MKSPVCLIDVTCLIIGVISIKEYFCLPKLQKICKSCDPGQTLRNWVALPVVVTEFLLAQTNFCFIPWVAWAKISATVTFKAALASDNSPGRLKSRWLVNWGMGDVDTLPCIFGQYYCIKNYIFTYVKSDRKQLS